MKIEVYGEISVLPFSFTVDTERKILTLHTDDAVDRIDGPATIEPGDDFVPTLIHIVVEEATPTTVWWEDEGVRVFSDTGVAKLSRVESPDVEGWFVDEEEDAD